MHLFKKAMIIISLSIVGALGYHFQKQEKLDNYFVEQFTIDYLIQSSRNEKHCHGDIFEKAVKDMTNKGYSQDEIYQIMVKGFDKATLILAQQNATTYLG